MNKAIKFIDTFSEYSGRAVSWLIIIMVLIIVYDVAMRYLFHIGSVALQELEWHLFSLVFLLGAAYTLKHDGHVRVDVIYESRWMNDIRRAWVNLVGTLFLLFPFCFLIAYSAWPFLINSYNMGEGSPDPGGLPYRFLLKAVIPISFSLLILQGVSLLLQSVQVIRGQSAQTDTTQSNNITQD